MNRWLNRKKDGGEDVAAAKKTKKGKKGQEEPKPEFDLSAALPKADDFRTSLIMPGLSTRFSMLKEQDDPDSKIGKASDDSVLQPKRQSRLHEFGFVPGGLSDIAEVSSLNGSIRPPFANERTNSLFDSSSSSSITTARDDDSSGSMMTRARPGEGNVLFGGRQKIYMISNSNAKGTGRTLYDDDVNMSAYQRLRQEEKDRLRQQVEDDEGQHSEPSSPTELSRKRETSSSTNSGTVNTRTSTAATSIASQGTNSVTASSPAFPPACAPMTSPDLSRSTTKRRLYDQGLDLQIQEQQSSAMNRLNSIQRARAPTGRSTPPIPIAQARSATNLSDRFARGPGFRSDSPNTLQYPGMSRNNSSGASSPVLTRPQSPALASPVISDSEETYTLNAALQPNDRGKATAMGTFNKPKAAFSEEQYAERLRHMQQDREGRSTPTHKVERSPPRKPTLRERAEQQRRKRAESDAKERSSSESIAEPSQATSAFSRFQTAASQMRTTGPATPSSPPPTQRLPEIPRQRAASPGNGNKATFLSSPNSSEGEEEALRPTLPRPMEPTRRFDNLPVATGPAPSIFEHPALRSRAKPEEEEVHQTGPASYSPALTQEASPRPEETVKVDGAEVDSPTLGPDNGGLSGMIRQHLRNMSNVSSNYGEPGPPMMSPPLGLAIHTQAFGLQRRQPGSESATPAPSTYSHSNPWDLDDIDNPYRDENGKMNYEDPADGQGMAPLVMSATEPNPAAPWDLTPRRTHERIASNETEADHEAFQRDLAYRQRLIQENLRAKAEGRSTSPAPGGSSGGLKTALNMLRAKSSRESFATVEVPNKSVRKLGLGGTSANVSCTSLVGLQGDVPPLPPKQSRVLQQSEQDAQRELENRQRSATESSRTGRPTGRSTQASTRSSTRERSSSGTSSGRSRSRPDQYRDDLDQAMTEGSRGAYPPNTMPSLSGYVAHPTPPLPAERPSLDSQGRVRSRSNSKTAAANYFESKHLHAIQTHAGPGQNSRLPLPQGKFSPGVPISPRPSPGGYNNANGNAFSHPPSPVPPFSANQTPPVSNPTTPSTVAFNPSTVQPLTKPGMLRKKSIAKSEISEPVFVSTTSSIDTINLPAGASLKNGMENDAPPVPPINPMRRRFGFGRGESQTPTGPSPYDPAVQPGMEAPRAPYAEPLRTNSSDGLMNQSQQPKGRLRKASSEGRSLRANAQSQFGPSPAMPQNGFAVRNDSPPRPVNGPAATQQSMEGGMF